MKMRIDKKNLTHNIYTLDECLVKTLLFYFSYLQYNMKHNPQQFVVLVFMIINKN